jgi:hypothetical protein
MSTKPGGGPSCLSARGTPTGLTGVHPQATPLEYDVVVVPYRLPHLGGVREACNRERALRSDGVTSADGLLQAEQPGQPLEKRSRASRYRPITDRKPGTRTAEHEARKKQAAGRADDRAGRGHDPNARALTRPRPRENLRSRARGDKWPRTRRKRRRVVLVRSAPT